MRTAIHLAVVTRNKDAQDTEGGNGATRSACMLLYVNKPLLTQEKSHPNPH